MQKFSGVAICIVVRNILKISKKGLMEQCLENGIRLDRLFGNSSRSQFANCK